MNVSISIQAHPKRKELVLDLLSELGDVPVAWSRGLEWPYDVWDTKRRALLDATGDYHCVIQDDAILCPDFRKRLDKLVSAGPEYIYSLFYRHKPGFPEVKEKAIAGKPAGFFTHVGHVFGVGVVVPRALIEPLVSFGDDIHERGDDYRMKRFSIANGIETYFPLPSLVDHRNERSLAGHSGHRKAWMFG